jgi:transporter family-2 protein
MLSTLFIGAILPVQAVLNTKLGKQTGGPLISSLLSFLVGLICLFIINLFANYSAFTNMKLLSVSPWYVWLGGLLGAIYVSCVIFVNQQKGALTFALSWPPFLYHCLRSFGLLAFCSSSVNTKGH